jgi:uncharacterized protein YndB with AHSA1/START domain
MHMNTKNTEKAPTVSDTVVRIRTGKFWKEWFAIIDKAGGMKMSPKEIVALLDKDYAVGPWWQQTVSAAYQQARGLNDRKEEPVEHSVGGSKTVNVPLPRLFLAWEDKKTRRRWLSDADFTIRTATKEKSMRITWVDGQTEVEASFSAKGQGKSRVAVEHSKLKDAKAATEKKAYWTAQLGRLKEFLE